MEKTVPSCISRKGNRVKKKKTCKEVGNNKKKKILKQHQSVDSYLFRLKRTL